MKTFTKDYNKKCTGFLDPSSAKSSPVNHRIQQKGNETNVRPFQRVTFLFANLIMAPDVSQQIVG